MISLDGGATLEFPVGALAEPTEVGVMVIENTAPGGVGTAYRFTPSNLELVKPAMLSLEYEGENPKIARLVMQKADGFWLSPTQQTLTEVSTQAAESKKKISVQVKRLADLAHAERFFIAPLRADVAVGHSLNLTVYDALSQCQKLDCSDQTNQDSLEFRDAKHTQPIREVFLWKINNSIVGSDTYGTVNGSSPFSTVTYTAPKKVPTPNPVVVTADILLDKWGDSGEVLLNSYISIRGSGDWYGTLEVVFDGFEREQNDPYSTTEDREWAYYQYHISKTRLFDPAQGGVFEIEGTGNYVISHNYNHNFTEQVDCSELVKNKTRIEKAYQRSFGKGGNFKSTTVDILSKGNNTYSLVFNPPSIPFTSKSESWRYYKGPCNPFSDTPGAGLTSRSSGWGNSSYSYVEGFDMFNPSRPNELKGSRTFEENIYGLPTTITIKWDFKREP